MGGEIRGCARGGAEAQNVENGGTAYGDEGEATDKSKQKAGKEPRDKEGTRKVQAKSRDGTCGQKAGRKVQTREGAIR